MYKQFYLFSLMMLIYLLCYTLPNIGKILKDELEVCGRKCSKPIVRHYKSIFLKGPWNTMKSLSQDTPSANRESKCFRPEFEAGLLTATHVCFRRYDE
jgi:hypothetical protein